MNRILLTGLLLFAGLACGAGRDEELLAAVRTGRLTDVYQLVEQGANPNAVDANGMPVLFHAEVLSVARALTAHGADMHARDRKGRTVLHEVAHRVWASGAWREELDVLKYFLRMGVDPHAPDNAGESAWAFMRKRFCMGYLRWDAETILLVEQKWSPLLARDDASFDVKVPAPMIRVRVAEESEYEPDVDVAYRWFASTKELLPDGRIRLGYDGLLRETGVCLRRPDLDYDSCRIVNGSWSCALRGQAKMIALRAPAIRLEAENKDYVADRPETVQTAADGKDLQPDGDVILACAAELKHTSFSTVLSDEYDYASCKMLYGAWVCNRR